MLSSLLLAVLPLLVVTQDVVVQTSLGPVSGSLRNTTKGRPYYSFQGLPYAAPPVGPLRLLPPQPPNTWTEVLDLTADSQVMCPQLSETVTGDLLGQEDCLYLNIYAPVMESDSLLPVMVFIYGGGFITGSDRAEEYGPSRWLEEEVLVVTLNYRLYSLGFMSLGTSHAPGNQVSHSLRRLQLTEIHLEGLLDQSLALRLVKDNVREFGGDPGRVTLMGQSAGSSSALYHLMSPHSEGLFQQIIAQSGSNFSPSLHSITAGEAARFGIEASIALGCVLGDGEDRRLECLQGVDLEKFVRLNSVLGVNLKPNEDAEYAENPFLPMSPMEALRTGRLQLR